MWLKNVFVGLRRGEPVRKVEGEIEVKTMEDGGRRKEEGERSRRERDGRVKG